MTLFIAMLLDAIFGEPRWLWSRIPHPAIIMGQAIGWTDHAINKGSAQRLKGALAIASLGCLAVTIGLVLQLVPTNAVDVIVVAALLAHRSLSDHVANVAKALQSSLGNGRKAVAMIVGRDTKAMTEPQVARGAIESAAENLSDGVIAPIFWFMVAGLPGILLYKLVNTADSMIGYLSPRHEKFGWAAARLDDLLNFVPARLTAAMILLVYLRFDLTDRVWDDAPAHRSPNAGWPEAALAYTLNFALSGPRSYGGELRDYPFVNAAGIRELGPNHIHEAVGLLWRVWALALIPAAATALFQVL